MKGDFSRRTFDATKHYSSVRMQQGRVQLDADWNEQAEIAAHRIETEALDVIGRSGGPIHDAGFRIVAKPIALTPDEQQVAGNKAVITLADGEIAITAGRYYVDGILCENERIVGYTDQPDLKGAAAIPNGTYLAYLDVWQRHITTLDDGLLREVALGGPDTTTRTKTVWQVKLLGLDAAGAASCEAAFNALKGQLSSPNSLRARDFSDSTAPDPCIVPPSAGYRGLENQLYRVEIHHDGDARDMDAAGTSSSVSSITGGTTIHVNGSWTVGEAVEVYTTVAPKMSVVVTVASVAAGTVTSSGVLPAFPAGAAIRIRRVDATYKWSRDNGSIATMIETIDGDKITVHDTGRDTVLGFASGQWVEISDDRLEENPAPGEVPQLAQIKTVDPVTRIITLVSAPAPLKNVAPGVDRSLHPKLRRWDGLGAVQFKTDSSPDGWLELEDGVQIRFSASASAKMKYRASDYWLIPARSATADAQTGHVEWPKNGNDPVALLPVGIEHHYAALGIFQKVGGAIQSPLHDCRHLFPPLTELTSFFYLGGDGQEAMPDLTLDPAVTNLVELPAKLRVGVANGSWPVDDARVDFTIKVGAGQLVSPPGAASTTSITTKTVAGIASATFSLGPTGDDRYQVEAQLYDEAGHKIHLPILFSAHRSIASRVAYDPGKECDGLKDKKDVQAVIHAIAHDPVLSYIGGDGQSGEPGEVLPHPLTVEARNHCGPMSKVKVRFTASDKGLLGLTQGEAQSAGKQSVDVDLTAAAKGLASCWWKLDPDASAPVQEVTAELIDKDGKVLRALRFTGNPSSPSCGEIVARPGTDLQKLFESIKEGADAHVCFSPGLYELKEPVVVKGRGHLVISGAGAGSLLRGQELEAVLVFVGCKSVTLRELRVEAGVAFPPGEADFHRHLNGAVTFEDCGRVTVENAELQGGRGVARAAACLTVRSVEVQSSVRVRACDLEVGEGQVGLLIVDASRAEIEDNTVRAAETVAGKEFHPFRLVEMLADRQYRERIGKLLISDVRVDLRAPQEENADSFAKELPGEVLKKSFPELFDKEHLNQEGLRVVRIAQPFKVAGRRVSAEIPAALMVGFRQLLDKTPKPPRSRPGNVKLWLSRAVEDLLKAEVTGEKTASGLRLADLGDFEELLKMHEKERRAAGFQGIVVGGSFPTDIRILNNSVSGVVQGIHVGMSHHRRDKETRKARIDRAGRTLIAGNTVEVQLSAEDQRERHGIFSGNSRSTVIENNVVRVERLPLASRMKIEGIRVYGSPGALLMVRQNHLVDFNVGIRVRSIQPSGPANALRRVYDNMSEGVDDPENPDDIQPPMP